MIRTSGYIVLHWLPSAGKGGNGCTGATSSSGSDDSKIRPALRIVLSPSCPRFRWCCCLHGLFPCRQPYAGHDQETRAGRGLDALEHLHSAWRSEGHPPRFTGHEPALGIWPASSMLSSCTRSNRGIYCWKYFLGVLAACSCVPSFMYGKWRLSSFRL